MTISTFFLIVFHDEKSSVRKAGFLYLIAAHCGTFCLFLMFFLMSHQAGSMDFGVIAHTGFSAPLAGTIFALALLGFGVKAGVIPLHIWLPHAHPVAPSHVSALLSGVAIKVGIYGIFRVLWLMGALPHWCSYVLMLIGIVSGLMGVLYALGQHELKRLLAYHSIENIGIILLGMGLGSLGQNHGMPFLAVAGFGGALLHVLNHALFKGLLFFSAGAVIQRTHIGEMDQLGGLAKTMPWESNLFLVGALAICGMPIFNGFVSEFIIFTGLFYGLLHLPMAGAVICMMGIVSLALMGALAAACFTKVYGTVFLGAPRHIAAPIHHHAKTSRWMLIPMTIAAAACLWIGLFPATMVRVALAGGAYAACLPAASVDAGRIVDPLSAVVGITCVFVALGLLLTLLRMIPRRGVSVVVAETWHCGYAQMTPRAQYSASSFARPIVDFARGLLLFRREGAGVFGLFPERAELSSSVHDAAEEAVFRPFMARLTALSTYLSGKRIRYTQMYLMYIFLFLMFLLIWKMR
jgi:hydrogenase-4 component B